MEEQFDLRMFIADFIPEDEKSNLYKYELTKKLSSVLLPIMGNGWHAIKLSESKECGTNYIGGPFGEWITVSIKLQKAETNNLFMPQTKSLPFEKINPPIDDYGVRDLAKAMIRKVFKK